MRLSLTTSGLLDPRQLSSWSAERQRAIHAAVAKGMQSGGREVRDAARNQMRSAFTVKRSNFISSMGVKIFDKKQNELPALWVGSKIPWLGIHERGGTVSGNLLIPLLPNRIGPKRFKAAIDGLMRSGNAYFIEKTEADCRAARAMPPNLHASEQHLHAQQLGQHLQWPIPDA